MLGRNVIGREDIVKRIAAEGHQIASHSYDHLNHWKVLPWKAIKDIKKGWQTIDSALGVKKGKYPFRPAYGKLNIFSLIYLLVSRVPICYWSIVSGDTCSSDKSSVDFAAKKVAEKGGGVVLMHDFDRSSNSTDEFVIDSLKRTIAMVKENSMKMITFAGLSD